MRILWLKTELLHPVDKGGRIRTYNMLREMKREHTITYLTLDDGSAGPAEKESANEYCHELVCVPHTTRPKFSSGFYVELGTNLISPLPYFIKKYESTQMRSEIRRLLKEKEFDVLVCDFLQPSINVPDDVHVATVLFQHNVEAMIWKRHYEVQRNPLKKAYLLDQFRKSKKYEGVTCRKFDLVVTVSEADEHQIRTEYNVDNVAPIPTGVDIEYFHPQTVTNDDSNVVFTGSMDWLPNEDAMQYFIREIMPIVRREVPQMKLTIVGRNPYASLIEVSKSDPNVIVTGRVEDVRPYIAKSSAFIVPIRIGGGTRLKIYEAMAMGKPVVSTTVGAEGLPVTNGKEVLIADGAQDFADALVGLLRNKRQGERIGNEAAAFVRERFSWGTVAKEFSDLCLSVAAARANS